MGFPTFSRTVEPGFIYGKVEAVSSGESVCIGGIVINSGEIIFGDNDGVVAVDPVHLSAVIEKAQAIQKWEHKIHAPIARGHSSAGAQEKAGPIP